MRHGVYTTYVNGCRCEPCKGANRRRGAAQRARWAAEGRKRGKPKGPRRRLAPPERQLDDGRFVTSTGYVRLPRANEHGTVLEHRAVMEEMLGRALHKGETVHHRNGDRLDNRRENLQLRVGSHPKGQNVADLLEWARWVIAEYGKIPDSLIVDP